LLTLKTCGKATIKNVRFKRPGKDAPVGVKETRLDAFFTVARAAHAHRATAISVTSPTGIKATLIIQKAFNLLLRHMQAEAKQE
jgi:hypothetical protein